MSNDDSFNERDEIFSLYSSKKVTDTFKAQLKKIAANKHLPDTFLKLNNENICDERDKKNSNRKINPITEKQDVAVVVVEKPTVVELLEDNSPVTPVDLGARSSLEDSIEVISEFTPKSTRQSKRLRKKKGQSNCELNINSNMTCNKQAIRKKRKTRSKQKKKIIEEVTLEDSPQLAELEDELNPEVSVKVIWKSVNIKKFQMRKFQKFSYIYEELSKEEKIPEDKIMLTFKSARVNRSDTPDSLNLQVYDFLDGGLLSELSNSCQTPNSQGSECKDDSVLLKFQDANKKVIKINLNKNEKLKIGMIKCSEQLEIPLNKVRFYFDGELLEPTETPDSLGLENEEVIDIKICV